MGERKRAGDDGPSRLYQREGIFYARVQVNGKEHRRSLKTSNRREAERRLKSWLADISPYHGTVRATFKEAATLWVEAGQWKQKTVKTHMQRLDVLLEEFGHLFWDQVDKGALLAFMAKRKQMGTGVATLNRYLTVVSGIAKHVRELPGWPDHNPVEVLPKKPRIEKRKRYVRPPASDIEAIFARMRGAFGDMCRVALECGARRDELVFLKWSDVKDGRVAFTDTKNHTPRVVTLTTRARAIVEAQPKVSGSEYVFNSRNGGAFKRPTEGWREVRDRAQNLAHKAGRRFTGLRFHDLRHEYAIRYLEAGGSLYTLKRLLGHGSIRQTEEYLDYLTPEQAAKAMEGSAQ